MIPLPLEANVRLLRGEPLPRVVYGFEPPRECIVARAFRRRTRSETVFAKAQGCAERGERVLVRARAIFAHGNYVFAKDLGSWDHDEWTVAQRKSLTDRSKRPLATSDRLGEQSGCDFAKVVTIHCGTYGPFVGMADGRLYVTCPMRAQKTFAGLVAVGLSLSVVPLGCGAAAEDYVVVQSAASESTTASDWSIPESAVEQMRSCLKEHAHELNTHSHEAKLDLMVTEDGDVQKVRLRSSTLHHDVLESCLMQALAAVAVPPSVLTLRSSGPVSGGEWSRDARGPLGVAQALAGAAAAGPIILMALGVTIAVYVAAVATEQAIEAATRRRKIDLACDPPFFQCLANPHQPDWNIGDFGTGKDCLSCLGECRLEKGIWPDYKCPRPNYRPN